MHRVLPALLVVAAIATACQSEPDRAELVQDAVDAAAAAAADDAPDDDAPDDAAADGDATDATSDEPEPAPASDESCGEPATLLTFDSSVDADKPEGEPVYYCVEVPSGQATVTFTLGGLEDDLGMWVAYDTYELVVEGGIGPLHHSDSNGTVDEQITVEPAAYRGELIGFESYADVSPGPYWIEITGAASPFTLTVTGEAA